jgi:hypothetical protein
MPKKTRRKGKMTADQKAAYHAKRNARPMGRKKPRRKARSLSGTASEHDQSGMSALRAARMSARAAEDALRRGPNKKPNCNVAQQFIHNAFEQFGGAETDFLWASGGYETISPNKENIAEAKLKLSAASKRIREVCFKK